MSNPSALGAIEYEAEATFAENVSTFGTLRMPILDPVDTSGLIHRKFDSSRTQQYRQAGSQWILAEQGGSFKTRMYLPGHGSSTSGATSATALETLYSIIFGGIAVSAANGTTFTGGTATAPTTTASGTFAAGSIGWAGVLGDARGGGQAFVVSTHAATTLNLLTALPAAPNNADVCYSAVNIYSPESPTTAAPTSIRARLLTANQCYQAHGVVPTAATITGFGPNEVLVADVTWGVSRWLPVAPSFPSTLATDQSNPAVNAAGSLFVNDVGSATRAGSNVRNYRNFRIDYTLGMVLEQGPGGVGQYQAINSAKRTVDQIKVSWTEDADAATTTPTIPGFGTGTTSKHILWTGSTAAGSRVAMYMPNVCASTVAVQKIDQNINRTTFEGMAYTGPTTTNDLTLSAFRMAFA